jgi:hypothetical protein
MQDRPVCFGCDEVIEHSPVFEAPCGHDDCCSGVWHGVCLMEWREKGRDHYIAFIRKVMQNWFQNHPEGR